MKFPRCLALLSTLTLAGCLFPERPAPPRLFAPVVAARSAHLGASGLAVRLRPLRAPLHLREAIAWRRGEAEFGQYEQRQWTELPATYVERTLDDALASDGIEVTKRADAPTLSLELRRFEEVLSPAHEAVVEVELTVTIADRPVLERRVSSREPISDDDPALVALAIGVALDEVATEVARSVRRTLPGRRAR